MVARAITASATLPGSLRLRGGFSLLTRRLVVAVALALASAALAITATGASAASTPEWKIAGSNLGAGNSAATSGSGGPVELKSTWGSIPVVYRCAAESSTGTIKGGGSGTSTLQLKTCAVTEPKADGPVCKVPNITGSVLIGLVRVGSKVLEKFLPTTEGGVFFTVKVTGEECPLSGSYAYKGSFAGYDAALGTEQTQHPLQFSQAIDSEAGTGLTFGGKASSIVGTMGQELSSPNLGKNWSGS